MIVIRVPSKAREAAARTQCIVTYWVQSAVKYKANRSGKKRQAVTQERILNSMQNDNLSETRRKNDDDETALESAFCLSVSLTPAAIQNGWTSAKTCSSGTSRTNISNAEESEPAYAPVLDSMVNSQFPSFSPGQLQTFDYDPVESWTPNSLVGFETISGTGDTPISSSTTSGSIIDWKCFYDSQPTGIEDKGEELKSKSDDWNSIPQRGCPTNTPSSALPGNNDEARTPKEGTLLETSLRTDKRKAIISPEFVQYSTPGPQKSLQRSTIIPTRRPSKKNAGSLDARNETQEADPINLLTSEIRCKCSGHCRNARCACVKAGMLCSKHCKCTTCRNPFKPLKDFGVNPLELHGNICLMQSLSKIKDMKERLESMLKLDCCGLQASVIDLVRSGNGFKCNNCSIRYEYSWCSNKLFNCERRPRSHCSVCKRCVDHRYRHCNDCNHCYFAGVSNTFSCSCVSKLDDGTAGPTTTLPVADIPSRLNGGTSGSLKKASGDESKSKEAGCPVQ